MKRFLKTVEDFTCEVCGTEVEGTGYTDHCLNCLWSKHVDVFPGDRQSRCAGLMKPIGVAQKRGKWRIVYCCQKCGQQKVNRVATNDNMEMVISLSQKPWQD